MVLRSVRSDSIEKARIPGFFRFLPIFSVTMIVSSQALRYSYRVLINEAIQRLCSNIMVK